MGKNKIYTLFGDSPEEKKIKRIINLITLVMIGLFISWGIFSSVIRGECAHLYSDFLLKEFEGVIIKKYMDAENHNYQTIRISNQEEYTIDAMFSVQLYEKVTPGDYIIKHKNELTCTVISERDTAVYKLDIPDCERFKE